MAARDKQGMDDFKWTVDNEISLFEAMTNYKIAGNLQTKAVWLPLLLFQSTYFYKNRRTNFEIVLMYCDLS